jgi:cell division protein FtsA
VVVTGGTSMMRGVAELAEQVFDVPVRRGTPTGLGGLGDVIQSPTYTAAVGLALAGAVGRVEPVAEPAGASFMQRVGRSMRGWLGELL